VAEGNVARGSENEAPTAPDAAEGSRALAAETQELQAKAQKSDS
jgi:hypothetical protein